MSVTIISVGNGGFNVASDIINAGIFPDNQFIVVDTDPDLLKKNVKCADKGILLEKFGRSKVKSELTSMVDSVIEGVSDTIIVCATLGGMTGSKYAPLIALNAVTRGKFVCSVVSIPADYEGAEKIRKAQNSLHKMIVASNLVLLQHNEKLRNYDLSLIEMNRPIVDTLASVMSIAPSISEAQTLLLASQQSEPTVERQNDFLDSMIGLYGLSLISGLSLDEAQKYVPEKYREEDKVRPLIWIKPDDYWAFSSEQRCEIFG